MTNKEQDEFANVMEEIGETLEEISPHIQQMCKDTQDWLYARDWAFIYGEDK